MFQTKLQDKTLGKELNEMEISCLLDEEFKVIVIKHCRQVDKLSKNVNNEIKIVKKRTYRN